MRLLNGEFIAKNFGLLKTDLLWRIEYRPELVDAGFAPECAFVVLHFESQGKKQPYFSRRVFAYNAAFTLDYIEKHPNAKALPPVLTLVLAHSKKRWEQPACFGVEQYQMSGPVAAAFARFLPTFDFITLELAAHTDAELAQGEAFALLTPLARLTLLAMQAKARGGDALASDFIWNEPLLSRLGEARQERLLRYIYSGTVDKSQFDAKIRAFNNRKTKEHLMTTADQIKMEGRIEGRAEGRAEGILAGMIRMGRAVLGMKPVAERTLLRKTREELQAMFDALVAREPRLARAL
jgi:hypothetical protein